MIAVMSEEEEGKMRNWKTKEKLNCQAFCAKIALFSEGTANLKVVRRSKGHGLANIFKGAFDWRPDKLVSAKQTWEQFAGPAPTRERCSPCKV